MARTPQGRKASPWAFVDAETFDRVVAAGAN